MKIENFKMKVTPEQSKRVQEVCFENGVAWPRGDKTTQEKAEYLFLEHYGLCGNSGGRMACSSDFSTFSVAQLPELTYAEFMAKYAPKTIELKLEVGKTYLNRKGDKVKIIGNDGHEVYPFDGDDDRSYRPNGKHWGNDENTRFDLISENVASIDETLTTEQHNTCHKAKCHKFEAKPPQLNPAHLTAAFRIFGPYNDVEDIAKIVNIVLENVELFEKLRGLENELNR